jgi:hypothetical protein
VHFKCRIDDEIYEDFKREFPEIKVEELQEVKQFKSEKAKAKWRDWMSKYEKKVKDYNMGTLLRKRPDQEYDEANTMFGMLKLQRLHHASVLLSLLL